MKKNEIQISNELYEYILSVSLREHNALTGLRKKTAKDSNAIMQIPPEQGQFMAFLIKILGAKKALEIGTYTGYSTLCIALALPEDGHVVTCDINSEWTKIGQNFWREAHVEKKIDLCIGNALDSLDKLLENEEASFDFVFIDADKSNYDTYYERALRLLRSGGVIVIDNVFLFGSVVNPSLLNKSLRSRISDEDILAMRNLNEKIKNDKRVDLSMLSIADGLTLCRKR